MFDTQPSANSISELAQKIAYYQGGGKDPGERTVDKIGTLGDTITSQSKNYIDINKAINDSTLKALEAKKLEIENKTAQTALTPMRDITMPLTKENATLNENTTPEQKTAQNELYAKRDAMGDKTLGQAKAAAEINKEEAVTNALSGGVYFNPTDGTYSITPDASHQLKISPKQAATEGSKFGLAGKKNESSALSPEAIEMNAQLFVKTGQLPSMGLGPQLRTPVFNRAAQILAEQGKTADAIAANQMAFKSGQGELSAVQKNRGVVGAFINTLDKQLNLLDQYSQKVDRTGVPALNRWINAGRNEIMGDPDVNNLNNVVNTVRAEYSRAMNTITGGGAQADEAVKRVEQSLTAAKTPEQIQGWANTVRAEAQNRQQGYEEQINQIKGSLFDSKNFTPGQVAPPKQGGPQATVEPPGEAKAAIRAANGKPVTFKNGQSWKFEKGKFLQVNQ